MIRKMTMPRQSALSHKSFKSSRAQALTHLRKKVNDVSIHYQGYTVLFLVWFVRNVYVYILVHSWDIIFTEICLHTIGTALLVISRTCRALRPPFLQVCPIISASKLSRLLRLRLRLFGLLQLEESRLSWKRLVH